MFVSQSFKVHESLQSIGEYLSNTKLAGLICSGISHIFFQKCGLNRHEDFEFHKFLKLIFHQNENIHV